MMSSYGLIRGRSIKGRLSSYMTMTTLLAGEIKAASD